MKLKALLACAGAIAVAACGGDDGSESASIETAETAPSEVTEMPYGGDGESDTPTMGSMSVECRNMASTIYGVDIENISALQALSSREDGSIPFNGELADGRRFQCNFKADGQLLSFDKVEANSQGQAKLDSETDLMQFEGARAGQAEFAITNLGYENVASEGLTNIWVNRTTGQCFAIKTSNGRYASVEPRTGEICK